MKPTIFMPFNLNNPYIAYLHRLVGVMDAIERAAAQETYSEKYPATAHKKSHIKCDCGCEIDTDDIYNGAYFTGHKDAEIYFARLLKKLLETGKME